MLTTCIKKFKSVISQQYQISGTHSSENCKQQKTVVHALLAFLDIVESVALDVGHDNYKTFQINLPISMCSFVSCCFLFHLLFQLQMHPQGVITINAAQAVCGWVLSISPRSSVAAAL